MLDLDYVRSLKNRDFQSVFVSIMALAISTAGDAPAIAALRFELGQMAEARGFTDTKITALRKLAVDAQRKAHMMY